MRRMSAVMALLFGCGYEQDAVDLVDLDELHLDALVAGRRQVLPDVVGAYGQLAVPSVDEHCELDALGAAVIEERLDRRADRPPGVEDVVDEDDRLAFEREVERRRTDNGLCVQRRAASANLNVVAVEGDVDRADRRRRPGPFLDETPQALRDRDTACLDPDECDTGEVGIRLDQLVRDPRERSREPVGVEQDLSETPPRRSRRRQGRRFTARQIIRLLPGLTGPA